MLVTILATIAGDRLSIPVGRAPGRMAPCAHGEGAEECIRLELRPAGPGHHREPTESRIRRSPAALGQTAQTVEGPLPSSGAALVSSRHPNRVAGRRPEEVPTAARVLDRVDTRRSSPGPGTTDEPLKKQKDRPRPVTGAG